jgi:membrane protease YdiL (CAAX protease family)
MSVTRRLQAATILRAAPPVLLLLAAMGVPSLAGPVTVVLAAGAAIAIGRSAPVAWAWAAVVPAGALATARAFSGIVPSVAAAACEASGSPRVTWAVAEALVVLATFTALAIGLRTRRASVGVRMPARSAVRLAAGGFGILGIGSVVAVSAVRGAIPGPTGADPSTAAFVAAVLVGAAAIALAEELAFRGVLQDWLARTVGEAPAIVVQAAAYGVWVAAVGWGPVLGLVAAAAGVVAGVVTARTSSILVVLAWHAAIAVGLLAAMLCG